MFIIKNCINQYKILIQDTTYLRGLPQDINFNLYRRKSTQTCSYTGI